MTYFQSYTRPELEEMLLPLSRVRRKPGMTDEEFELKSRKRAKYRAKQIFVWVYQRFVTDWDEMTDLSKDLRSWLKENIQFYQIQEKINQQSLDGTHKFLWSLHDQKTIESVIIPAALKEKTIEEVEEPEQGDQYRGAKTDAELSKESWSRLTACISSQVGCAMACKFCLTGIQGLDRHLETHEIVSQIFELRKRAPITNIVFMGMGEPLHNVDNVIKACQIFVDEMGLKFSRRKVTVSTSGLVPAIRRLGRETDVTLAVSLNGSTDEQRTRIMPVNRRWNIKELLDTCRNDFPTGNHRRITFEYVLLDGINDSIEDAKRVARLLEGIPNKVNLIPFNEHPGSEFKRSSDEKVRAFHKYLVDKEQMTATVRHSRGQDILAACGQLRSVFGTARGSDRHKDWSAEQKQTLGGEKRC